MAKTLPGDWQDRIVQIHQGQPWHWCWDFQLQKNASVHTRARLVGYPETLAPSALTPLVFYPYPITQGVIEESGEGDLPQLQVQLSNVGRMLAPFFETVPEDEGIIGSVAQAWLLNRGDLSVADAYAFEVVDAEVGDEWCGLRLELPSFFERRTPQDRYSAQRCRWRFGTGTPTRPSPCGYIINAAAAFTTCGKTYDECVARGDDEEARNLTRLHPRRFGGQLGIPRQ